MWSQCVFRRIGVLLGFVAVCAVVNASAQPNGPSIIQVQFPASLAAGSVGQGTLLLDQGAQGVERLRFDVVDGRYRRLELRPVQTAENLVRFQLSCTAYDQNVVLQVSAKDRQGRVGDPQLLRFVCGRPPQYNFDQELAQLRPTSQSLNVHVFILDDGVTALAENAVPVDNTPWSEPDPLVARTIANEIVPALTGIWDQCALAFTPGLVRVVRLDRLDAAQGSVGALLFSNYEGDQAVVLQGQGEVGYSRLQRAVVDALRREGIFLGGADAVVFVTGSRILMEYEGKLADIEGFSVEGNAPSSLVRWGAAFYDGNNQFVLPRQMVATLAHELGHQMGLEHPGSDGLTDTANDDFNLMRGSGVTPNPRANLLPSQCQVTQKRLAIRQASVEGASSTAPDANGLQVTWEGLVAEQQLHGKVGLRVTASGFEFAQSGFAQFSYAQDGERFSQIAMDTTAGDDFTAVWDTTALKPGRYLLRVKVVDGKRQQGYASVWVRV